MTPAAFTILSALLLLALIGVNHYHGKAAEMEGNWYRALRDQSDMLERELAERQENDSLRRTNALLREQKRRLLNAKAVNLTFHMHERGPKFEVFQSMSDDTLHAKLSVRGALLVDTIYHSTFGASERVTREALVDRPEALHEVQLRLAGAVTETAFDHAQLLNLRPA